MLNFRHDSSLLLQNSKLQLTDLMKEMRINSAPTENCVSKLNDIPKAIFKGLVSMLQMPIHANNELITPNKVEIKSSMINSDSESSFKTRCAFLLNVVYCASYVHIEIFNLAICCGIMVNQSNRVNYNRELLLWYGNVFILQQIKR